jgi:hypothetical protein
MILGAPKQHQPEKKKERIQNSEQVWKVSFKGKGSVTVRAGKAVQVTYRSRLKSLHRTPQRYGKRTIRTGKVVLSRLSRAGVLGRDDKGALTPWRGRQLRCRPVPVTRQYSAARSVALAHRAPPPRHAP